MRTLDIDDRDSRKGRKGTRRWVGKRWGKESPRVERRSWGHTQPQSIKLLKRSQKPRVRVEQSSQEGLPGWGRIWRVLKWKGQLRPRWEGALFQGGSCKSKCILPEKTEMWWGVFWQAVCYIRESRKLDPRKEEVRQGGTRARRNQRDETGASEPGPQSRNVPRGQCELLKMLTWESREPWTDPKDQVCHVAPALGYKQIYIQGYMQDYECALVPSVPCKS